MILFRVLMAMTAGLAHAMPVDDAEVSPCDRALDQDISLDTDFMVLRRMYLRVFGAAATDSMMVTARRNWNEPFVQEAIAEARELQIRNDQARAIQDYVTAGRAPSDLRSTERFETRFARLRRSNPTTPAPRPSNADRIDQILAEGVAMQRAVRESIRRLEAKQREIEEAIEAMDNLEWTSPKTRR